MSQTTSTTTVHRTSSRYSGPPLWAFNTTRIYLKPTRRALLLLCPLIQEEERRHALSMPAEVWARVLRFAMESDDEVTGSEDHRKQRANTRLNFLSVCKAFKAVGTPIMYSNPIVSSLDKLDSLSKQLIKSDEAWDSIRRIPFSTPGRWIASLDISHISPGCGKERLQIDNALTLLFPITPFLSNLHLNPQLILSRRAFASLGDSCGPSLRVIKGLGITDDISFLWPGQVDPVTILVSKTPNLEVLEIIGQGTDDLEPSSPIVPVPPPSPLSLNHLHTLSLVATPVSPVVVSLIETPLPSLSTLTMTSYHTHEQDEQAIIATQLGLAPSPVGMIGGFPGPMHDGSTTSTLTSLFLEKHGQNLTSLILCSASDWPPVPFTPPPNLLKSAPNLRHLTLLSKATGPPDPILFEQPDQPHPLETITLNKPVDGLLQCLDECMKPPRNTAFSIKQVGRSPQTARNWTPSKGKLPNLTCVHFLAVKWLRMRGIPMNAGTNGGMKEWSLVLRRYGIKVYDMEDKEL